LVNNNSVFTGDCLDLEPVNLPGFYAERFHDIYGLLSDIFHERPYDTTVR